jgi:CheY-like chemotaxis protein/anti-sigma regulatory factor (Ser/Thr protein kinase)
MSKIETGKLELNSAEYDAPVFVNDTVQLNIVRIGSKQIDFILDIDESLPSVFYGDELRLKQVLNNLLSNAIKYTEEGHVKLSVSHILRDGDTTELRFDVEDTGQGIKPEDQERLFSEYTRFNAGTNKTVEGTGLGLPIAKRLVEMMGGAISVKSEYGKGSIFTVTVTQKSTESPAIGAEIAGQLQNFTFAGDRQTSEELRIIREQMPYGSVLVVDDVETNLYVAEGLLEHYKLSIETATCGSDALDKVRNGKIYDVIFMDHMMPEMDGIETTQKLRSMGYKNPVVALTANALAGNDEMFMKKGFDGFLSKPIDVRQLNFVLNKFIRDKYPGEAKKYQPESEIIGQTGTGIGIDAEAKTGGINPKILQIFCKDAQKAAATLRETSADGNLKLYTTTAHAMKSALANVGEHEASKIASVLEYAGLNGNTEYITDETENFVKTLEALICKFSPAEASAGNAAGNAGADVPEITENTEYLTEQLKIIEAACEGYDDDAAYAALDRLQEKNWKPETADLLEQIRDALFIYSDFDGAAKQARAISDKLV